MLAAGDAAAANDADIDDSFHGLTSCDHFKVIKSLISFRFLLRSLSSSLG